MRKGIGPRGLGAVKSPAKQTSNHSAKRQNAIEGEIRSKYSQELDAKRREIKNRTYKESGIYDYAGDKKSPEYQRMVDVADARVMKRMMNNKGPKEIRAKRDAEIGASRATYEAMPSTQSRKRSAK